MEVFGLFIDPCSVGVCVIREGNNPVGKTAVGVTDVGDPVVRTTDEGGTVHVDRTGPVGEAVSEGEIAVEVDVAGITHEGIHVSDSAGSLLADVTYGFTVGLAEAVVT